MKKINKKYITVFLVIIVISIGFAALATQLSILGTANVSHQTWDIYWDNVEVTDGSVTAEIPVINPKTKVSYAVSLVKPGDFFEFTVDAVNNGTIDAMIDTITNSSLTADQLKYINYSVTYKINNKAIQQGHKLDAGKKITYKVRLEYRKDIDPTDLGDSDETLNLSFEVTYKQANNSAIDPFTYAMFDTGINVSNKLYNKYRSNKNAKKIKRAEEIDNTYKNSGNVVSISNTEFSMPIYMWYDTNNEILYYYSDADILYLNENSSYMFREFSYATEIDLDGIDTSYVSTFEEFFKNCLLLESIDLSGFDTSSAKNMRGMFQNCRAITKIDVDNFDTSGVTDMTGMFREMWALDELNVTKLDTHNVNSMACMFDDDRMLNELDVSHFDTSNVTKMNGMFYNLNKIKNLDVSGFDTRNVTNMNSMFSACSSLISLDLSSWDTNKVTTFNKMFWDCRNLAIIYASEKTNFSNATGNAFSGNRNLVGENGTRYDYHYADSTYAKVDGYTYDDETEKWIKDNTIKGYFTLKTTKTVNEV